MSNVVAFPTGKPVKPRSTLRDAQFIGRPCCAMVWPEGDRWVAYLADEDGGYLPEVDGTKEAAMQIALDWVRTWNAELRVSNAEWGQ